VLERLLRRAESARLRGADEHVALTMGSASSGAEYVTYRPLCRWAERAGWPEIAAELQGHPIQLEQESLEPDLPGAT
jgi:hypothetical protein